MNEFKYLYFKGNEEYWFEINEENIAYRQIIKDEKNSYHLSCLEDCLAEESVYARDDFIEITDDCFNDLWNDLLHSEKQKWREKKNKYSIDKCVKGTVCYFYPQGTIVHGNDFIGVYKGNTQKEILEEVYLQIISYDEKNMWLILDEPQNISNK